MKILITSGGTKVPVDMVRSITNMSKGTFGSAICKELLMDGHQVDFLMADGSKTPFKFEFNMPNRLTGTYIDFFYQRAREFVEFCEKFAESYSEYHYKTFDGYSSTIYSLLREKKYDMVILAAAVSDYGVANYVDGKIRSKDAMTIELSPYPKVISEVRGLQPDTFLVGFKLLVNSSDADLQSAAYNSLIKNKCDAVVANDLEYIKQSNHTLLVVTNSMTARMEKVTAEKEGTTLPRTLVNYLTNLYNDKKKGSSL